MSDRRFLLQRCAAFLVTALIIICSTAVLAAEPAGERALLAKYPSMKGKLEKNQFGAPIYLESAETQGALRVDVYGVFNQPFDTVKSALQTPANWCDIAPLHINIKGCAASKGSEPQQLTLYSGRKYYQPISDTYPLKFDFRVAAQSDSYLSLALSADRGPLGTKDHRISLEAVPLDRERALLHFSYTYTTGAIARAAIKTYLATIGRDKVGFTVVTKNGKPAFIEGVRGAIERNAVRYYLAIETYLETLKYPEEQRFEQRLSRWYDLTAKYARQLKEMEKPEYLSAKRREHANQLKLQNSPAAAGRVQSLEDPAGQPQAVAEESRLRSEPPVDGEAQGYPQQ